MKSLAVLFAVIALCFSQAVAQEGAITAQRAASTPGTDPQPELGLNELLALALRNNPQSAAAIADYEAARLRAASLARLPNPILQLTPGRGGTRNSRDEEAIVSQSIDVFGQRRAQRTVADAEARQAKAGVLLSALTLATQVKNSAAKLFSAQEAESLAKAQWELASEFHNAALRRAQLGEVPQFQADRAGLEVEKPKTGLITPGRRERSSVRS